MLMYLLEPLMSLAVILVVLQVLSFFIAKTFIGKSIILIFKITKASFKITYLSIKKTHKGLNKTITKLEKQLKEKKSSKEEVIESDKVVNLESYRNK